MNHRTPGLPVHHQLPEFTQTHVHWVGDVIQPSHPIIPFSSYPQSFPASESFQMSHLFTSGGQSIRVSGSASVLPMKTQDWSPLGWTGSISLQSKGLSKVFSTPQFKSIKSSYDKSRQHIKKQRYHFANKGLYRQSYGHSRSHVQMGELDHIEGLAPNNWCFWTMMMEKTLQSPLDSKEIKAVNP